MYVFKSFDQILKFPVKQFHVNQKNATSHLHNEFNNIGSPQQVFISISLIFAKRGDHV